ncbi:MAG: glycosyltransferase family 2 protein [Candidatus Omnitrophica bacterium]|nr:glycosyltransferase family 2 protein [Candidatus Omnitrophota bacterium]
MLEAIFIGSAIMTLYAYIGYPLSLMLFAYFRHKTVKKQPICPKVSFVITAHNEEKRIQKKIENTLALDYPRESFQIIVTSDGSTDLTNAIVNGYKEKGVILNALGERRGKERAQKEALKIAKGDIIVFSDVATLLEPQALKEIVSNFADPEVGCVSSEDRVVGINGQPSTEGIYVRYEMWLRRLESKINSLVGLSGSFFAARKEVCQDFSAELQSDFRTVLSCVKLGLRGVSDPRAIGYYHDVLDEKKEFDRKVRTVLRGLTVFFRHIEFLNPFRYKLFSYQFFCHKLLRWLVPFFLFIAFLSNALLIWKSNLFLVLFLGQVVFYGAALWGRIKVDGSNGNFLKIPTYFLMVNASILIAWWRYFKGQRVIMWNPSER